MDIEHSTDLDLQLQQLAGVDWETFTKLIGEENIMAAKICMLKRRGKSLGFIAQKLKTSKHNVRYRCDTKCLEFSYSNNGNGDKNSHRTDVNKTVSID